MGEWQHLKETCAHCQKCGLSGRNIAFGTGIPTAEVMLISDYPKESKRQIAEEHLLRDLLLVVDLSLSSNLYWAHLIKCLPQSGRPPLLTEYQSCLNYLRKQVSLISPKIILCLGETVAKQLIGADHPRGTWVTRAGVEMTWLYSPSDLLDHPEYRPLMFQDLLKVKNHILEHSPQTYKP